MMIGWVVCSSSGMRMKWHVLFVYFGLIRVGGGRHANCTGRDRGWSIVGWARHGVVSKDAMWSMLRTFTYRSYVRTRGWILKATEGGRNRILYLCCYTYYSILLLQQYKHTRIGTGPQWMDRRKRTYLVGGHDLNLLTATL